MRRYKVIADSVTSGRLTFKKDFHVNEDQFAPGVARDLEKRGALEFVTEMISEEIERKREPTINDYTRQELMEKLRQAGVKYSNNSSKVELYETWKNL